MSLYSLQAKTRNKLGKHASQVRIERLIPAVVYGNKVENQVLTVSRSEFEKVYAGAGASNLVDLIVEGGSELPVLIHDVQRDPRINEVIHIDFYQVNMAEKLSAHLPLKFIGESKAVKGLGGILIKNFSHIEVRCLPKDLVPEIIVDIGVLHTFEDVIKIKDLAVPDRIEVLATPTAIVATVTAPLTDEELKKSLEGKPEANVEDVKVEEKGKKEEKEEAPAK
ncbi:50S ribosomal protein L25 [Candidatus Uhrbacteria bacterium]|nr:50S ribosomal protein L25 [Candidatus Uhrbacteria bacterium]